MMHGASMRALPTVGDVAAQRTISGRPLLLGRGGPDFLSTHEQLVVWPPDADGASRERFVCPLRAVPERPIGDALTDGGDHRPGMAVARLGPDLLLHDLV